MSEIRNLMTQTAVAAWEAQKWTEYVFKVPQLEIGLRRAGFSEEKKATPKQVEVVIVAVDAQNRELNKLRDNRSDNCDPMPCASARHIGDNPPLQPMRRNAVTKDAQGNFVLKTHAKGGGVIEEGNFLVNTELKEMRFYCPSCKLEAEKDAKENNTRLRWYTFETGSKVLQAIARGEKAKIDAERRASNARAFEFGNPNVGTGQGEGRPSYKRVR